MAFNPSAIRPASKSTEFSASATNKRDPKSVLMASIDSQLAMFKEPKMDGKRWFTAGKAEIAFTLRYSNRALTLVDNESKVVVPTNQFEAAMLYYKEQAGKGQFDAQLATLADAVGARGEKMKATRAAKKAEEAKP